MVERAPVIAAWGAGVDSTAMSVENRLAHIRLPAWRGVERLSGTINLIRRIGCRFINGIRESISDSCPNF